MARFLDVNVWLPLVWDGHIAAAAARAWVAGGEEDLVLCRVTQLALLRHLTNPVILGADVLSNREAASLVVHLQRQEGILFEAEPTGLGDLFPAAGESPEPHGLWWTDAYLAAFAIAAKHELATFDRGFGRYETHGLRWSLLEVAGGSGSAR
ncbi:TA system VapC family ribonuclease toxin [Haloferula sp. A504]|uniref:TA system VapC family ribonuclease toxin n=1 Tax=Haloferula sp. A504 TaxID=3373601 RepID=UPI0031C8CC60|nr:PIN domain-containing protein [Verrucomicrobiaceae bacterium E54]